MPLRQNGKLTGIVPEKPNALTDTSPMPFGKYRNVAMQDVPVSYLHYIVHNFQGPHIVPIKEYCKDTLDALKLENKDLIWKILS